MAASKARPPPWYRVAQRHGRRRLWESRPLRSSTHPADKLATLWTLRILLRDPSLDRRDQIASCLPQEIADAVGLPELGTPRSPSKKAPPSVRGVLEKRLRQVEADPVQPSEDFPRNMAILARVLGLTPLERDLLGFALVMQGVEGLASLFRSLGPDGLGDICRSAALALAVSDAEVRRALRKEGVLRSTGLVSLDLSPPVHLALQPMPDLSELLLSGRRTARTIMRQFLREAPATRLDVESFAHVADDVRTLVRLISGALRRRALGVNVLLHGAPGTGKTELVRVVAKEAGARLFEVADEDEEYDSKSFTVERLSLCALAQQVLARAPRTLLLFDEIEDVFSVHWQGSLGLMRQSSGHKSWTHRLVEKAPVPTFWLCNEIRQIDPATLRRFDLVVELRVPPSTVRVRMLHDALGATKVDDALVGRLATDERMTPAHVARAVRTTRLMGAREGSDATQALSHVLGRNLDAQGPARAQPTVQLVCGPYELGLVNASADLAQITDAIVREKRVPLRSSGHRKDGLGEAPRGADGRAHEGRPRVGSARLLRGRHREEHRGTVRRGARPARGALPRRGRQLPAGPRARDALVGGDAGQRAAGPDGGVRRGVRVCHEPRGLDRPRVAPAFRAEDRVPRPASPVTVDNAPARGPRG
jgi:transitional endoplasmic reticulum ATPase